MKIRKKLPLLITEALDRGQKQVDRADELRGVVATLSQLLCTTTALVHVEKKFGYPKIWKSLEKELVRLSRIELGRMKTHLLEGDPLTKLFELCAKKSRFELIAASTHGKKNLSRMVLGSVTEELTGQSKHHSFLRISSSGNPREKSRRGNE